MTTGTAPTLTTQSLTATTTSTSEAAHPTALKVFTSGMISGLVVAVSFNPWDKALYMAVKHKRPFLDLRNFYRPYEGFMQTAVFRVVTSGAWYPLFDISVTNLAPFYSSQTALSTSAGFLAGAINGAFFNPLSTIKYYMWGKAQGLSWWNSAKCMWKGGGVRPFMNGMAPTILRDMFFGGTFGFIRPMVSRVLPEKLDSRTNQCVASGLAAGIATAASAPFNYARNMQYSTRAIDVAPTTLESLQSLVAHCRSSDSFLSTMRQRLNVGWGTARVAVGMGITNLIYTTVNSRVFSLAEDPTSATRD